MARTGPVASEINIPNYEEMAVSWKFGFRFARQNEAAGAADAAAWAVSAVLIFGSDNCGSQGGVRVTHLRKMLLQDLQRAELKVQYDTRKSRP